MPQPNRYEQQFLDALCLRCSPRNADPFVGTAIMNGGAIEN